MHFYHVVALPGEVEPHEVESRLEDALAPFDEQLDCEPRISCTKAEMMGDSAFRAWWEKHDPSMTYVQAVRGWEGREVDVDGNVLTISNPQGEWDWWVVGGRWGSFWTLRPEAPSGPLDTEPSTFGFRERHGDERATDCARWQHLMPESVKVPYSWLDLDGRWYTKWLGRELSGSNDPNDWERGVEHDEQFMKFLASLPPTSWLINVDYHS